jgi:hypothetical protein
MKIASIVEGDGEVIALPIVLRRFIEWRPTNKHVDIQPPIRVPRDRFLNKDDQFDRYLKLARGKCGHDGWILIVLDADDDCPAKLGANVLARAQKIIGNQVSVVLPNREFEAWFIGAAGSLTGHRGLTVSADDLTCDAELPRNAKGWLGSRMGKRSYGEMTDQPAFAASMDFQQAFDRCRSFRKLCAEWDKQMQDEV